MGSQVKFRPKPKRSLIRKFVSFVPDCVWRVLIRYPTRIYLHPFMFGKFLPYEADYSDEGVYTFQQFSSYLSQGNRNSTPKSTYKKRDDSRIQALQDDLKQLKEQIGKIMEQQHQKCSQSTNKQEENTPPIPPPLPPPLPSFTLTPKKSVITKARVKLSNRLNCPSLGGDMLKDLDKVKLRKVEKSPGGGPIKQAKEEQDPADVLQKILRKRYLVIQSVTPDTPSEHDWSRSYEQGTPCAASE